MLTINNPKDNLIEVAVEGKITYEDIATLQPLAEKLIAQHGKIRLFANASKFEGWDSIGAMEKHMVFVKDHQQYVERVAVITGHFWQEWFAGAMKLFLQPEIKTFKIDEQEEARQWVGK
jgi:hypothetical protein